MDFESANKSKLQELNERLKNVDRRNEDDYDVPTSHYVEPVCLHGE